MITLVRVDCRARRLNVRGSVLVGMGAIQLKGGEDLGSNITIFHMGNGASERESTGFSPPRIIILKRQSDYKYNVPGFPGGAVVENLPANAGDTGSSPGLGRSHMPRSNWAGEPQLLSLRVWSLCSATREATVVRGPRTAMKSGPRLPQLEKALAQKRRPNTAKNK